MKIYTVGVVGAGSGGKLSIAAAEASPRFQLAAAADLRAEARAEVARKWPHAKVFATHEEMFAQCPTDVVCVSTYAPSHKPIALDALRLPLKGILVEKPLGDTSRAGREIIEAVRAKGIPMAVPHGLLAAKHGREIIRRVWDGEIGDLRLVEIENSGWDIINAGIHWLNFFVTLVGADPPASVLAACDTSTRTWRDGMQVETVAVTLAETRGGVRCVLHTGDEVKIAREGRKTLFRVIGAKGRIEFWGWPSEYILSNEKHAGGAHIKVEPDARTNHRVHLENMADQIEAGAPDYTIPESSLRALELCEAAYLSNRRRCQVVFPLDAFTPPLTDWDPGQPYSGFGGGRDGRKL